MARARSSEPEWHWPDALCLAAFLVVGFGLVVFVVINRPLVVMSYRLFDGTTALWTIGIIALIIGNLSLGALAVGLWIETFRQDWSRFEGGLDHCAMWGSFVLLIAVDGVAVWWLLSANQAHANLGWHVGVCLALGALSLGTGAILSWHLLWPNRNRHPDAPHHLALTTPLFGLLGFGIGVALPVLVLIGSVAIDSRGPAEQTVPHVSAPNGPYVAVGDSYSAGQGNGPFIESTKRTNCDRSQTKAYPEVFMSINQSFAPLSFTACSDAIIHDVENVTARGPNWIYLVDPQVDGRAHADVRLLTITIGGNDALFSNVAKACVTKANCLTANFPLPGEAEAQGEQGVPVGPLQSSWAPATIGRIGQAEYKLFSDLEENYESARIVVLGYPYLFPTGRAPLWPTHCFAVLSRYSETTRIGLRDLQDQLNNEAYEAAAAAGVEFVSPRTMWDGHEACGSNGEYTNGIKLPEQPKPAVGNGTLHPNTFGQTALAALVACYLNAYPEARNPYSKGHKGPIRVPTMIPLEKPADLGLSDPPGYSSPVGSCR